MTLRRMHNPMSGRVIENITVAKRGKEIMRPGPRMERQALRATFRPPHPENGLVSSEKKPAMEEDSVINKSLSLPSKDNTPMASEKEPEAEIIPKLPENSSETDSEPGILEESLEKFPDFFHPDVDLTITQPITPISEDTIQYYPTPESERNRAKSALLTFFSYPGNRRGKLRITKKGSGLEILNNCWSQDVFGTKLHIDTVDDIIKRFFSATNQYDTLMISRGVTQDQGINIELQDLRK
ncbi:uncharacterized protein EAF01_012028 [Botrytis porri]|uniref:Uncharacterized protein n=1 Tax=Botrytis porri TaxID=87229 RepID=A0A4Z1KH19_9HELO|nr:uncharacterized protein EAF01_012028 [Botrytis porri]KAF7880267.1 hypothetical protein EAF01_012028 [Botrytis porri]TGO84656.1 hypothetical protein BPOR_0480g00040 [Botrytis porri]